MKTLPATRGRKVAVLAGSAGLMAGLVLGATGLASATPNPDSSPAAAGSTTQPGEHHQGRHEDRRHGAGDLVTAISGDKLSLDTPQGPKTVTLTSSTTYKHGKAAATVADVKPNEIVRIQYVDRAATNLVAKRVDIELAREVGYVTQVQGPLVTITDINGFTRVIQESATTTYRNKAAAGSATDVTVGSFIRAVGNVDGTGTVLQATEIGVGQPAHKPGHKPGQKPEDKPAAGTTENPSATS